MKLVYVSNYMNHHVKPLCDELFEALGQDFCFIQTDEMTEARKALGWGQDVLPVYVKEYAFEREVCDTLIMESDIAVIGWSSLPFEIMEKRFSNGKPAFRLSERIYKEGRWKRFSPRGLREKEKEHGAFRDLPVYLLCVGAYVAGDFELIHCYPNKMFRWGYFTEVADHDFMQWKDSAVIKLLWAGRLMDLKHPEYALQAAVTLRERGVRFHLDIVGDGELRESLEMKCKQLRLDGQVTFHGALKPDVVRTFMQEARIFLFTSNYLEGWGAVVGEAMSASCAVVASAEAGAVPFLIRDGENGLIYEDGKYETFLKKLLSLVDDMPRAEEIGRAARETMCALWNAECAARRLLEFSEALMAERDKLIDKKSACPLPVYGDEGPMTAAPILKAQSFFRTMQEKNRQDNG